MAPAPPLRVSFAALSSRSLERLRGALRQWADWHAAQPPPAPGAPLHSGTYTFFPAAPASSGHHSPPRLHFWVEDSAKAAQLDPGLPENTDGEAARPGGPPDSLLPDELDVPLYDRSTDVTLEASTWSALGNASRDEQAPQRCFNCGSYSHKLQTCPRPRDNAAIDAAREQLGESQRRSGIPGLARYHNPLAPDVTPGSLSPALRDALGISALDPPPWLAQMRRLGYPPGYLVAQADESPRLAIYEDEGGLTTVLLAAEEEAASLLPSPSPPAAAVDGSEIEEGEMEVSMDLESSEEDGEDGEAVAASTLAPTMAVAYPGINSPIPDGADPRAWGLPSQSVNPGETASRRSSSLPVDWPTPWRQHRHSPALLSYRDVHGLGGWSGQQSGEAPSMYSNGVS